MRVSGMRGTRGSGGVTPSVYASWLQKSVRRGLFDEAVWAAAGLYSFASQEKGAPLLTFLLNRLEIIAMEDIGLGDPFLVDSVMIALDPVRGAPVTLENFDVVAGVVRALCTSPKTRLCSWLKCAIFNKDSAPSLGSFGDLLEPIIGLDVCEIKKSRIGFDFSKLSYWCWTSGKSNRPEWYYGIIMLLIRSKKYEPFSITPFESGVLWARWCTGDHPKLEGFMRDIVLDIHTGAKKRTCPAARYKFAIHGAHVENEVVLDACTSALKEYYNECKRTGADLVRKVLKAPTFSHRDIDIFTPEGPLIGFKTPTLFAHSTNGKDCFVKLMAPGSAQFAMDCHLFRKKLGLFSRSTRVFTNILMTLDYASRAPLCSQKASERNIGALERRHNKVVDVLMVSRVAGGANLCHALKGHGAVDRLELLKVLFFRRYVESTDTNSNNIVVSAEGRCLSVDENEASSVQYKRWCLLERPDTVFTAQKNGNLPQKYVGDLKIYLGLHREEILEFLKKMQSTEHVIHRNEEWLSRVLECVEL